MKKLLSIILSLFLIFNTLPLSAQEGNAATEDALVNPNQIRATINREISNTVYFEDTPPVKDVKNTKARHDEFLKILKRDSDEALAKAMNFKGTYSEIQTALNYAFLDPITPNKNYPDSKYFKGYEECGKSEEHDESEEYCMSFFDYALEVFYQNTLETQSTSSLKDLRNKARNHIRQMIGKRSQSKDFFAMATNDGSRNPMNEASYLIAYYHQINNFYDEVRELKIRKQNCKNPKMWGYTEDDCFRANALADKYNLETIKEANRRIGTFVYIAADEVKNCLQGVLFNMQTPFIPFEEIEDYLKSRVISDKDLASCGLTKNELFQVITDNTITRAEAKQYLKKGIGPKILQGLSYISFSYWMDRMDKDSAFASYVALNFGRDKLEELGYKSKEILSDVEILNLDFATNVYDISSEFVEEREIAEVMAESYNAVIFAIASDLVNYGKIYYYNWDNIIGEDLDKTPVDAGRKFATTWYDMSVDPINQNSPIAQLARDAIYKAGGKAKEFQNQQFAKSMLEAKQENNIKANLMVMTIALDFLDPIMILAPLKEIKTVQLLRAGAKYAPKTTRAVYNATKAANKAVKTTKAAVKSSQVGQTVAKVSKPVKQVAQKVAKPVKQLKTRAGKAIYDAADDWSDIGRYAGRGANDAANIGKAINKADDIARLGAKGSDATKDITKVAAETTPTPAATTALSPEGLGPKLTDGFDEIVAKAGNKTDDVTMGFYKAPKTPSGETKPLGYTNGGNSGTTAQGAANSERYIGFNQQPVTRGKSDPADYIGLNRQPVSRGDSNPAGYIGLNRQPTATGKTAATGTGGPQVQDFTKGNNSLPGQRSPEGPGFRRGETPSSTNPYDIRNSVRREEGITIYEPDPPAPIKQRNDWVSPERTLQETLDSYDAQIAELQEERKKLGLFSRDKKAKLDSQIEKLKERRSKFFNSIKNKNFETHSPIYDQIVTPNRIKVEKYLADTPIGRNGGPALEAKIDYAKTYNLYLDINVDGLPADLRTEFVDCFDDLSNLKFSRAISIDPVERQMYEESMRKLKGFLNKLKMRGQMPKKVNAHHIQRPQLYI